VAYFAYDFVLFAFDPAYHAAVRLIPLLVFGVGIWGLVPTLDLGSLVVPGKTWIRSAATGAAALGNVSLNLFLVPRLGGVGAAIASVTGYVFLCLVTGILSYPLVSMRPPLRRIVLMVLLFSGAIALSYLDTAFSYPAYVVLRLASFVIVGGLMFHLAWRFNEAPRSPGPSNDVAGPSDPAYVPRAHPPVAALADQ
jgi:O-antigen/teichoic acid export membrane protein